MAKYRLLLYKGRGDAIKVVLRELNKGASFKEIDILTGKQMGYSIRTFHDYMDRGFVIECTWEDLRKKLDMTKALFI